MQTYLDDAPISTPDGTLGAALDAARAASHDRLVIEVLADGLPVPPEHLDDPPSNTPYAQELRFRSAPAGPLIAESLLQAAEALESTRGDHIDAAEQIQAGEIEAAMGQLGEILAVWQRLQALVELVIRVPGVSQDAAGGVERASVALSSSLTELRDALTGRDWSTASDVLIEDLPALIDQWGGALRAAAQIAAGGHP
ncbi:MAG: hypothetical protein AAGI30_04745 [Planctomycetota bacterium]